MFATATTTATAARPSQPRRPAAAEWGPAKHDRDHPLHRLTAAEAALGAVDLRDGDESRPDDN